MITIRLLSFDAADCKKFPNVVLTSVSSTSEVVWVQPATFPKETVHRLVLIEN